MTDVKRHPGCAMCGQVVANLVEHWEQAHPVDPSYVPPPFRGLQAKVGRPPKGPYD